jgi:hypothetical protein
MKARCNNPSNPGYCNYGGRGITYDPRWNNFGAFLADMGEPEIGLVLDRIDNEGNYCKENCRWVSMRESNRNTRNVKISLRNVSLVKGLLRSIKPGTVKHSAYLRIAELFDIQFHIVREIDRGFSWSEVV